MASIYLSYRPGDHDAVAGRLYDQLVERFGRDAVIWRAPGEAARARGAIEAGLRDAVVVVALIGPRWLRGVSALGGPPPLSQPDDPVRVELEAALRRRLPVIVALAPGGAPPLAPYLAPALRPLATLAPLPLRDDPDFRRDVARLSQGLEQYVAPQAATRGVRGVSPSAFALLGALALLVVAVSVALVVFAARSGIGPFGAHQIATTPTATLAITRTPTMVTTINDPLTSVVTYPGDTGVWVADVYGYCEFVSGGYRVLGDAKPTYFRICAGPSITQASDERVSITTRLTSVTDPNAYYGFYIRDSVGAASDGYEFIVNSSGQWRLVTLGGDALIIAHGTSHAIHTGLGAVNILTMDAYGAVITVYANHVKLGQVTNSDSAAGFSGLAVEHGATVVYTHFILQRYQ